MTPHPDRVANATGQVWSDRAHRQAIAAVLKRWSGPLTVATALGCYPDGKAEAKHTAKCRPYLRSWIDQANPSRVLLLGTLAAWGALGRSVPARSVRRGFAWVQAPSGRVPALMLMDPATLDGKFAFQAWEEDIGWALSTSDEFFGAAKQFMERATYEVVRTVEDAREACAHLRAWHRETGRPISWDVEARGKMHNPDFRVVSAALCGALSDRAFVWDRAALDAPEVAGELWALLGDPSLHFTEQGSYDERAKLCSTGTTIAGERDDVRLLRKLADPEVKEADLDTLSELVGFGGYKAEFAVDLDAAKASVKPKAKGKASPGVWTPNSPLLFDDYPDPIARAAASAIYQAGGPTADGDAKAYLYALVPSPRLSLYNARDAVATGLLREYCFAPIVNDPALLALWREVTQPASRSYTVSEHWGVPMSRHAVTALIQYGEAQKAQIAPQLRAHLTPEFAEIDLNSRDQVASFLFTPRELGGLGLTPPKRTERSGKDALDDEAKKALHGAHPFVDLWVAFTSLDAEVEKGQEFQRYLREDGCVHPSILLDGTRTGRPACVAKGTYIETLRDAAAHPRGIPIEDVREGDFVYCYDEEGQLRIRPVVAATRSGVKAVVRVHWQGSGHQHIGHIDLTPDHLVKLTDGRWLPAGELKPGDRVFALKRAVGSGGYARLWATGNVEVTREHRFVFKEVYGFAPKVVHHVNENKLDNRPINLEATNKEDHGRHHGIENAARKGSAFYSKHFQALWRDRRDDDMLTATRKGAEKSRLNLSREEVISILERNGWSMTRVRDVDGYDYETFQRYAVDAGLSIEEIKKRAENIARAQGRGKGRYKRVKPRVYICRNCGQSGHYKTTCPELVANNHEIVSVEPLTEPVEVYDLSVAGVHSFIANEICVHNCIAPNVYNMKRPEDCEHCKGKDCDDCGQTGADASSQLIRACFSAPSDDFVVCEIDLSQIEVRGIAALSGDPVLTEAYVRKEDVHSFVASHGAPLGVPLTRSDAKPVIFGKGYGQTAIGLANNLKLKRERDEGYAEYKARKLAVAERVYDVVSRILRGTEHHRAQVIAEAQRRGYTFNLWRGVPSQRRPLWEIASADNRARIHAENAAYSTLIQGSMSGLLVLASHARLVEHILDRGLSHLWRPVVCVYDSIIAVMHKAIVPLAARITVDVMTSWVIGHLADGRPFPLEADCKLGRNLAVAKKYKPPSTYKAALAECQSLGLRGLLTTEQTNRIAPTGALL